MKNKKGTFMNRGSTLFLRATLLAMGFVVLAFSTFEIPAIHREWAGLYPDITYLRYPVIFSLIATAIAFFAALYQAWRLLDYIDRNKAFSKKSVRALRNIKYCALIIGGLYAAAMPLIYYVADEDDAPGLIIIGVVFTGAPLVVAVVSAIAERLLQNAIDIKSENDLTV